MPISGRLLAYAIAYALSRTAEGIARVFYCTAAERRVILLHWFVKKTDKTPARELAVAVRRMKEVRHE